MKRLIISEEQLRLLIESEGEGNLMNLTNVYEAGLPYNKWDSYFLFMNKKKGGIYDGYYIDRDLDLKKYNMNDYMDDLDFDYEEDNQFGFEYLVRVNGFLNLRDSEVTDLSNLKYVERYLNINGTNVDRLPELEYVGGGFSMQNTKIRELPKLKYVGGALYVSGSPLMKDSMSFSKIESLPNLISVGRDLYLIDTPLGKELKDSGMSKDEIKNKFGVKGTLFI
jgi:hypothetical protein